MKNKRIRCIKRDLLTMKRAKGQEQTNWKALKIGSRKKAESIIIVNQVFFL